MNILILNGPNLNLLGKRDPEVYGSTSFEDYLNDLKRKYPTVLFSYYQSNIEGELVTALHHADDKYDAIIFNAGAYTHTSIALRDAISGISTAVVEVHISNVLSREDFRHDSRIGAVCSGTIIGFGLNSYTLAVESIVQQMIIK